jgi:4,5-dihydroxyphthalate decarboxylase
MTTVTQVLKTLLDTYPHTQAIKDGTLAPPGTSFEFTEIQPVNAGFNRMADAQEFDVSEMAITTYLLARAFDKPITGLPVVVNRGFHHGRVTFNVNSGIGTPKDLEGKRVGLRSYTQTTPLWVRGVLANEYDVNLDAINWIAFEPPHVRAYQNPANVEMAPEGKTLNGMLLSGEIDAAIGATAESPEIQPLITDAASAQVEWYHKTGVYPINHMVVVTTELARQHPEMLRSLYDTFKAAKQQYVEFLHGDGPFTDYDKTRKRLADIVAGDPLPYGIAANRRAIEYGAQLAYDMHITPKVYALEELFEPEVLNFD